MSLNPVNFPQHIFTSTMPYSKKRENGINVFIVIMTAILFFTVLAWFNFALAFYGALTTTDPDHKDETLTTLGFALMWTFIGISIYFVMDYYEVLGGSENNGEHPLLRDEGSGTDVQGSSSNEGFDISGTDSLGAIDMGVI